MVRRLDAAAMPAPPLLLYTQPVVSFLIFSGIFVFFTLFSSRNSRAASGCSNVGRLREVRLDGKPADPGGKVMEGLLIMTTGSADRCPLCRVLTVTHSCSQLGAAETVGLCVSPGLRRYCSGT